MPELTEPLSAIMFQQAVRTIYVRPNADQSSFILQTENLFDIQA